MSEPNPKRRKPAAAQPRRTIKTSVLLDVQQHARLSALASLRGLPISALIAEFVAEGVKGIVLIDRRDPDVKGDSSSRVESAA